jgi:hypothetical protein
MRESPNLTAAIVLALVKGRVPLCALDPPCASMADWRGRDAGLDLTERCGRASVGDADARQRSVFIASAHPGIRGVLA